MCYMWACRRTAMYSTLSCPVVACRQKSGWWRWTLTRSMQASWGYLLSVKQLPNSCWPNRAPLSRENRWVWTSITPINKLCHTWHPSLLFSTVLLLFCPPISPILSPSLPSSLPLSCSPSWYLIPDTSILLSSCSSQFLDCLCSDHLWDRRAKPGCQVYSQCLFGVACSMLIPSLAHSPTPTHSHTQVWKRWKRKYRDYDICLLEYWLLFY